MKICLRNSLALVGAAVLLTGCATRPTPDPRDPGPIKDSPELLRVCYVEGAGAHLAVGDQVEITTGQQGRLQIRHMPGPDNKDGAWNEGKAVGIRAAVLVEALAARGNQKNTRRFVPVGQFLVRVGAVEHSKFDFSASKATANLANNRYPECNVELGADEVLVRGVDDDKRHGGGAVMR